MKFYADVYGVDRITFNRRVDELFTTLEMNEFAKKRIGKLSTGMTQKVSIARTMIHNPEVVVFDEPTTGLHFADVEKLLELLDRLVERGNTVVVIEHHLDVVKSADHVIDLGPDSGAAGGRIVSEGTPETLCLDSSSHTGRALAEHLAQPKAAH